MSFSIVNWIVIGVIGFVLFSIFAGKGGGAPMVCKQCGHVGPSKRVTKGNIGIEIILWLCFIIPGVIYSIWRLSSRYDACTSCGAKELIPTGSPLGQKLIDEMAKK